MSWRSARPSKDMPPRPSLTHCQTSHAWWSYRHNVHHSPFAPVKCQPALICEENRVPMADLPILVISCKCQSSQFELYILSRKHKPTDCPLVETLLLQVNFAISNCQGRQPHLPIPPQPCLYKEHLLIQQTVREERGAQMQKLDKDALLTASSQDKMFAVNVSVNHWHIWTLLTWYDTFKGMLTSPTGFGFVYPLHFLLRHTCPDPCSTIEESTLTKSLR